ncbi:MAG: 4Fe-4S binding protein [Oscillospiraceae bacterium]|nr:4Fe-4S binding protein [Oscillospiraceae bacterium]
MKIEKVYCLCYSATGTTGKVVSAVAEAIAKKLNVPMESIPFTLPAQREEAHAFSDRDLVVVGSPTYAGRMPNKIMPDYREKLSGGGTLAVSVVTFGNRSFDNSLAELTALLAEKGFRPIAAGAFVCRHAFTDVLAGGRPGFDDLSQARELGERAAEKVLSGNEGAVEVPGDSGAPYYVPKGTDGQPAKFLKAKPLTDLSKCSGCGVCARVCPTGAIDPADVSLVPGVCIKCQACVRKCTRHAKYFEDPAFLSHVAMLEQNFREDKENALFW